MSLIEERQPNQVFGIINKSDLGVERASLFEAFQRLGVSQDKFKKKANHFFDTLERISGDSGKFSLSDFGKLVTFQQISQITEKWAEEKTRQDIIFRDFNSFISIINNLFVGKGVDVTAASELTIKGSQRGDLTIFQLSSGEKQLLILLGEALLQRHSPYVYIADEPELSLHLKWQERVIPDIMSLNENAQMIVATHSPDIIGKFGNNVIRMERLLKNGRK